MEVVVLSGVVSAGTNAVEAADVETLTHFRRMCLASGFPAQDCHPNLNGCQEVSLSTVTVESLHGGVQSSRH